jgi:hypothetical protein
LSDKAAHAPELMEMDVPEEPAKRSVAEKSISVFQDQFSHPEAKELSV